MTYRRLGSGPLLVLVPGIAGTYRGYALLLNRLAERFETIHYEYPGTEAGDGARLRRIGHADLVDDLLGLLDHLGGQSSALLGLSFGATVVLGALERAPGRFTRVVLQGAVAWRAYTRAERWAMGLGSWLPGPARRLPLWERALTWNCRDSFPAVLGPRWRHFVEDCGRTPIAALAHRGRILTRLDLRPRLGAIRTPVLVVRGHEDRLVPTGLHEELVRGLPAAVSRIVPLAGHPMHYTHAELMARVVTEFVGT
jgi:pimeloyl-ACP methyl ester carboxylesterase